MICMLITYMPCSLVPAIVKAIHVIAKHSWIGKLELFHEIVNMLSLEYGNGSLYHVFL